MMTRKLPPEREESESKRQRVDNSLQHVVASFDRLPTDCKVHAFSYLTPDELANVTVCSKDCLAARNNDSLNQERTGTLVFSTAATTRSVRSAMRRRVTNEVFSGNRTSLMIEGAQTLTWRVFFIVTLPRLTRVKKVEVSGTNNGTVDFRILIALIHMFPNATEVTLNDVRLRTYSPTINQRVLQALPKTMTKLAWNGGCSTVTGASLRLQTNLTEACLDGICFTTGYSIQTAWSMYGAMHEDAEEQLYLFSSCRGLERVSIKDAAIRASNAVREPLPQEFIIKFVRLHPSLRWVRSDLSQENVTMLRSERPEITFVSE